MASFSRLYCCCQINLLTVDTGKMILSPVVEQCRFCGSVCHTAMKKGEWSAFQDKKNRFIVHPPKVGRSLHQSAIIS